MRNLAKLAMKLSPQAYSRKLSSFSRGAKLIDSDVRYVQREIVYIFSKFMKEHKSLSNPKFLAALSGLGVSAFVQALALSRLQDLLASDAAGTSKLSEDAMLVRAKTIVANSQSTNKRLRDVEAAVSDFLEESLDAAKNAGSAVKQKIEEVSKPNAKAREVSLPLRTKSGAPSRRY